MADKTDIVFFTSTIAIVGMVYSFLQTGFLDALNDVTFDTHYLPQVIIMAVFVMVITYIVVRILKGEYSLKQASDAGAQFMQSTQGMIDTYNQFAVNREPKKVHALQIVQANNQAVLPTPEEVCFSLWSSGNAYKVFTLGIADTPSGKPLAVVQPRKATAKGLITLTQYRRNLWGKIALIFLILAAIMVYTLFFYIA